MYQSCEIEALRAESDVLGHVESTPKVGKYRCLPVFDDHGCEKDGVKRIQSREP